MACFLIDDETADNFRAAVRSCHGKNAWGHIKKELKVALDNHANMIMRNIFREGK